MAKQQSCRCGKETSNKNGQCQICKSTIANGFCPDCFNNLHLNAAEQTWDCWICKKSFYLPQEVAAAAPPPEEEKPEIIEETRPFNLPEPEPGGDEDYPHKPEGAEKPKEEVEMPRGVKGSGKPKRKYVRKPKEEKALPGELATSGIVPGVREVKGLILLDSNDLAAFVRGIAREEIRTTLKGMLDGTGH